MADLLLEVQGRCNLSLAHVSLEEPFRPYTQDSIAMPVVTVIIATDGIRL